MGDTVTIRFNKEEKELFKNAAKLYNCSISSMIKRLAIEKLEDDIDIKAVKEFEDKIKTNKTSVHPINELWKELDLND